MRPSLRSTLQIMIFCSIVAACGFLFQNCGSAAPDSTLANLSSNQTQCQTANCTAATRTGSNRLEISIKNPDPLFIIKTESAFDIGGYCNSGGFSQTRLYYSLAGPTPVAQTMASTSCDAMGRFHILVRLPVNYVYGQLYTLTVLLRGIDATSNEVDSPLGLNQRELNISTSVN